MASLDRKRAQFLMSEAGIDALVLLSPESFTYASGALPGVAAMWRKAGAFAILVPADASTPETAIVSDLFAAGFRRDSPIADVRETPLWVETTALARITGAGTPAELVAAAWQDSGRSATFTRPTTFDPSVCYRHLADALGERGLTGTRVGFEGSAISVADFSVLESTLGTVELVNADAIINRLKMVKSADEIVKLRKAVHIAEHGICAVRDAVTTGTTRDELARVWSKAISAHEDHAHLSGAWEYISVGSNPWGGNAALRAGDPVKVDVGCLVDGYTSDSGRTFVLGQPSDLQKCIFDALMDGFVAGSKLLKPGVPLSEVHRETLQAIRAAGFPGYTRGHFGHGLGAGLGSEEWPFISSDAFVAFEPGMVMAFECPWYIDGLGGFIIENQLLITEDGHEMMNTLPIDLVALDT